MKVKGLESRVNLDRNECKDCNGKGRERERERLVAVRKGEKEEGKTESSNVGP